MAGRLSVDNRVVGFLGAIGPKSIERMIPRVHERNIELLSPELRTGFQLCWLSGKTNFVRMAVVPRRVRHPVGKSRHRTGRFDALVPIGKLGKPGRLETVRASVLAFGMA